jgi:hypothetical protein
MIQLDIRSLTPWNSPVIECAHIMFCFYGNSSLERMSEQTCRFTIKSVGCDSSF